MLCFHVAATRRFLCRALLLSLAAVLAAACDNGGFTPPAEPEVIRLDQLEPLPAYMRGNQPEVFKIAIAAVLSPKGNVSHYRPLAEYFEQALDRPVRLVQRRNYQEINDLLAMGGVDVAFVCTGAYLKDQDVMDLLVVPRINGKTTYRALIIVNAASSLRSFEELRGKTFAFTDPLSNTGYLYPTSRLEEMGERSEHFFAKTIFTYGHDRSIYAVMRGLVDAASVDHLVYDNVLAGDKTVGTQTRTILESGEFGIPPVVVPAGTPPAQKEQLKAFFLHMHEDATGAAVLNDLGIDRFVEPNRTNYR
jgi:phosphonate transport system substrate-binding protein